MLNILIGADSSRCSDILCEKMVESAAAHPSFSFIAVVPEQATLNMQTMAVKKHPAHSVLNIDILSFSRLAHKVFSELGIDEADLINDTGKMIILKGILDEIKDDLTIYHKKVHMAGFCKEVSSQISELRQYGADDNDLYLMQNEAQLAGNMRLYYKLSDLRLILRKFNEAIEDRYSTQESIILKLAGQIKNSCLIKDSFIYMDGFTGFSPIQFMVIEELMKYSAELNISITIPERYLENTQKDKGIFRLSHKTCEKLIELAHKNGSEAKIIDTGDDTCIPAAGLFRAADAWDEALFAAEKILEGIRKKNMRFRDFAVITSDMASYHDLFKEVFEEAGISCFIDYKTELTDNVLSGYLTGALDLYSSNYSFDSVFSFLKCGLTDIDQNMIFILENYCLEFGIRGYTTWNRDFHKNRKDGYYDLEGLNRIRRNFIASTEGFYTSVKSSEKTAGDYSDALCDLMEKNGIREKLAGVSEELKASEQLMKSKEYEQVYELVLNLLVKIKELSGSRPLSADEYKTQLKQGLSEIKVGIIPPSLDAVVVGDLTRTRLGDVKEIFITGVNEGVFPAVQTSSGLLTRQEREFLMTKDFSLAPLMIDDLYIKHFYIYLMLTKPSAKVYLSYASMDSSGNELNPSYILDEIPYMLPGIKIENENCEDAGTFKEEAKRRLSELIRKSVSCAEHEEDVRSSVRASMGQEGAGLLGFFAQTDELLIRRLFSGAFYSNQALDIDGEIIKAIYGDKLRGSVSRIEQYYSCPFRFFLNYGIKLKERQEYKVDAADIGNIYHDSIDSYSKKLKEYGLSFRDVDDETSHRIIKECVAETVSLMESDVLTNSGGNEYMLKRIMQVAEKTTDVLRQQVRAGLYEPAGFEEWVHSEPSDNVEFNGRIDRIDLYDAGDIFIKIIDYKSGAKRFNIRDIYTGQQLQLAAYMSAKVKAEKKKNPEKNIRAGGVYYYLIQDKYVKSEKEALEKFKMSGITNMDPVAVNAIDTTLQGSASSVIAEISLSKNELSSRSKAVSDSEFETLMEFADKKIEYAGKKIMDGDVKISPYYANEQDKACRFCQFKTVCKFEDGKWGSTYNKPLEDIDDKGIEREIYGRS